MMPATIAPLVDTAQEFPSVTGIGYSWGFIGETKRGPILPAYGTRTRDRWLRDYYRHEYNTLVQGAISGLIKKVTSAPWEVTGELTLSWIDQGATPVEVEQPNGSMLSQLATVQRRSVSTRKGVEHYQEILQESHFGDGWKKFIGRVLLDYLTQDFGAVIEVIGPGDTNTALTGAVTGLAHLDSGRCYATGNPVFPIVYYSLITNTIHKMHHSRVIRLVDMPDGDERYFGYGLCALSRAIAIVHREVLMGRYIEQKLDDKPPPGIMYLPGTNEPKWQEIWAKYQRQQDQDIQPEWGRTLFIHQVDPNATAKPESIPFAVAPDKFDWVAYTNLHVNALALALGVDKQELWELTGGGIGTGAQSQIMHAKSQGKAFGDILAMLERAINTHVLPAEMEFSFHAKDTERDQAEAEMNKRYIEIAQTMNSMAGVFRPNEIRKMLADSSEMFREVLTDQNGRVELPDIDILTPQQAIGIDTQPALMPEQPTVGQPQPTNFPFPSLQKALKNYDGIRNEFVSNLTDLIGAGLNDDVSRRRFGTVMRAQLRRLGQKAFEAGLSDGGVSEPMDDEDLMVLQAWVQDQSSYVTRFADEVYKAGITPAQVHQRANMWANKSLQQMYYSGVGSANKNGMYMFVGDDGAQTCSTCSRLKGQVHRYRDWKRKLLVPRVDTESFECKGYLCRHTLERTIEKARGNW
jgi:hypothetical protein